MQKMFAVKMLLNEFCLTLLAVSSSIVHRTLTLTLTHVVSHFINALATIATRISTTLIDCCNIQQERHKMSTMEQPINGTPGKGA